MNSHKKRFIAQDKILSLEVSENKTWSGKPVWKLKLGNGKTVEYPEAVVRRIATKKRIDLTELQQRRTKKMFELMFTTIAENYDPKSTDNYPMTEKILEILAEDDLNITDDVRYILETSQLLLQDIASKILEAIAKSVAEANKVFWGMETHKRTMMHIDNVIKNDAKRREKEKTK